MQPLALVLNIAILVGIIGIVVYWVRRFAIFLGYKSIQPDVLRIAELLKAQPLRLRSDIVLEGHYGGNPTIVRFSHRVDTPGLDIQMRVPTTLSLFLVPKTIASPDEGRVVVRTGSTSLDRRFKARTNDPTEARMLLAGAAIKAGLEQLCCSSQTGLSINDRVMELSELTIPPFTANHVFDHLQSMLALATAGEERFVPSLLDSSTGQPNYSIHTVRRLKDSLRKSDKLYFLIGIDAFMEISTWYHPVELLAECDFIVVSRPGYSLADIGEALPEALRPAPAVLQALRKQQAAGTIALPSTTIHLLGRVNERVSSTRIRAAARKSVKQLSRFVPETVAGYIKKEHLYMTKPTQGEKEGVAGHKVLSFRGATHRSKTHG